MLRPAARGGPAPRVVFASGCARMAVEDPIALLASVHASPGAVARNGPFEVPVTAFRSRARLARARRRSMQRNLRAPSQVARQIGASGQRRRPTADATRDAKRRSSALSRHATELGRPRTEHANTRPYGSVHRTTARERNARPGRPTRPHLSGHTYRTSAPTGRARRSPASRAKNQVIITSRRAIAIPFRRRIYAHIRLYTLTRCFAFGRSDSASQGAGSAIPLSGFHNSRSSASTVEWRNSTYAAASAQNTKTTVERDAVRRSPATSSSSLLCSAMTRRFASSRSSMI